MKPSPFGYARPSNVTEALALLAAHGDRAAVLAGGQSLMPMMALRMAQPGVLVDINGVPGLDGIDAEADGLRIGALARTADVLASALVATRAPLLTEALRFVAHPAIRNRGTIGGSLALADPAAELPACAVCLDAIITTASEAATRTHPAGAFFTGLYGTARRPDELVLGMTVPGVGPDWRFGFTEIARRHGDYAIAGLAFGARRAAGRIVACRVAFCGVEPSPRRVAALEQAVVAGDWQDALSALQPMTSDEAPAAFRRHLAGVLLGRAVGRVMQEAVVG